MARMSSKERTVSFKNKKFWKIKMKNSLTSWVKGTKKLIKLNSLTFRIRNK